MRVVFNSAAKILIIGGGVGIIYNEIYQKKNPQQYKSKIETPQEIIQQQQQQQLKEKNFAFSQISSKNIDSSLNIFNEIIQDNSGFCKFEDDKQHEQTEKQSNKPDYLQNLSLILENLIKNDDLRDIQKILQFLKRMQKSHPGLVYDIVEISPKDDKFEVQILNLIGVGGFGRVYKAKCSSNDNIRAIKIFFSNQQSFHHIQEFLNELTNLSSIVLHENIIAIHGIAYRLIPDKNEIQFGIIEELMFQNLKQAMDVSGFIEKLQMTKQFLNGLMFIHKINNIHRDLKPQNIFTDEIMSRVKIGDLGTLSKHIEDNPQLENINTITKLYASPECILSYYCKIKFLQSQKQDIWSVGVIIMQMFYPEHFTEIEIFKVFPWLSYCDNNPQLLSSCFIESFIKNQSFVQRKPYLPPQITNIINKCLQIIPSSRPTILQLKQEFDYLIQLTQKQ